jgi:LacI family transcriptional regulator
MKQKTTLQGSALNMREKSKPKISQGAFKKKQPTIVNIANNLDISPASVSRALRDAGKVGESLKGKILAEAKRLGYTPNYAAKSLRSQSSQLIGLIIPNFFSFQIDELVANINNYSQKNKYGVIVGITQWDTQREIEQLDFMAERNVEGIIIKSKGLHNTIDEIQKLSLDGVKVVSLLDKVDIPGVTSVLVDNIMGGYLATKHLLEKGHRRILYVTYSMAKSLNGNDAHFSNERYYGMLRAYAEMNIERPNDLVFYDTSSAEDNQSEDLFREYLKQDNDFTAILTYDDQIAAGVVRAINSEGYKIPEDYSIISYDDSVLVNRWSKPPLTVIRQPDKQVAIESVDQIIETKDVGFEKFSSSVKSLYPMLVERKSVAELKQAQSLAE